MPAGSSRHGRANSRVQNARHNGVGLVGAHRGEVQRGLPAHLKEQTALALGLPCLVGPVTEPAEQHTEGEKGDDSQN